MTSDALLKLESLIKSINQSAEKLGALAPIKRTKLKRLCRECSEAICKAVQNYSDVVTRINAAPSARDLASKFRAKINVMALSINNFQVKILPLLPAEKREKYAMIHNNSNTLEMGNRTGSRSLLALMSSSSLQDPINAGAARITEVIDDLAEDGNARANPQARPIANSASTSHQRRDEATYRQDYMTQVARNYIPTAPVHGSVEELNHKKLVVSGSFIEINKAKIVAAFKAKKSRDVVAIKKSSDGEIQKYIDNKNFTRGLKVVGAVGGALIAPAAAGVGVGVALHYTTLVAISGTAAVAPWGAVAAGGVGGITFIVVGGIAAHRVRKMPPEERRGRSTLSLWTSEVGNCFTFNDEHMRNQDLYYKLSNWSGCIYGCVEGLIEITDEMYIDFAMKTLEAVLYYHPSQDKVLLDGFSPEGTKRQRILDQSIKLRYAFLKLIQENEACFIKESKTEASKTRIEERIPANSSFKLEEKDKKTLDAAKTAFICIIVSAIEHLKMKKEEKQQRQVPGTSFTDPHMEGAIDGEFMEMN